MSRMLFAVIVSLSLLGSQSARAAKPVYRSKDVTTATPGHAVDIKVDISGAKKLYLAVTDAGDGFGCDWADWMEPRLVGPGGEQKLTELKWKLARAGWGQTRIDRNANNEPLIVNNKPVAYGIGTHANSLIEYDLPEGFTQFVARGGLDQGGVRQGCGSTVEFLVFTEAPDAAFLQAAPSPDAGNRTPEEAIAGLDVADDLEVTLFAAEPMLLSPANIDVDHRGRVWVCEVVNYRRFRNQNNPERVEGDRILILEDTNGDGQADSQKVFYQGRDVDSAHGVCVLGNKVIVSAGDSVFVLTDSNGDDKADKKDVLFTGISGVQHDHGIHSFLFGPDGKLYFNFGNEGRQLCDANGQPVIDKAGNVIKAERKPYQEGLVFRCDLDGSNVETLGWNFRNNWEVAVDSFGSLWQSDNDDDGNRGVRINFVMEFGNYGYKDEFTGAGWREPRTGMEAEIPLQHWHLNDPGVVPNLLQTGAGSPTGIAVYEGTLLPERFHGQLIHCDAGPNVVRGYLTKPHGAGYSAEISDILVGTRDKWFRPSDVCVAPDGSLIIADWYDPGVGGHAQGDVDRGRLFRVAPPKSPYKVPKFDFSTIDGAIAALGNPNLAVRYLAWTALNERGAEAEPALRNLFTTAQDPRLRARAVWLLGNIEGRGDKAVADAIADSDADIRITGLRLARRLELDLLPVVRKLVADPSPAVQRECAIALRECGSPSAAEAWAALALRLDPQDRWMLEALGIGAHGRWDAFLDAYFAKNPDYFNEQAGHLIWRSRGSRTPELLAMLIAQPEVSNEYLPFLMRAFDFQLGDDKQKFLTALAFESSNRPADEAAFVQAEALNRITNLDLEKHPEQKQALNAILDRLSGTMQFVRLVDRFNLAERYPQLLTLAQAQPDTETGVAAAGLLLDKQQRQLIDAAIRSDDLKLAEATLSALGNTGKGNLQGLLLPYVQNGEFDAELRRQAVRALSKTRNGALKLVELAEKQELDAALAPAAAAALHTAQWRDVKDKAEQLFPAPPSKNNQPLPSIEALVAMKGDAQNGKLVYNTDGTCAKCHVVNDIGKEVGPNLSEIGSKLSRQALFESIVFPSAGISHNYETHVVLLEDGTSFNGILVSETPDAITLKGADAIPKTVKKSQIEEHVTQKISLMPADLQKLITVEELVDIVEYMQTLKKK